MRAKVYRIFFYVLGLLLLAMGLTLNTKAGMGVSPIISVSYSISHITHINFGNTTFGLYGIFVIIEVILHTIRGIRYEKHTDDVLQHAGKIDTKLAIIMDLLQLPLSMIFTRFLNLFSKFVPEVHTEGNHSAGQFIIQLLVLILALILTGIGAAMSLDMRLIPNPGDGIVQAISDFIHKSVGFTKNCFDILNVTITVMISLVFIGHFYGIGIGTVLAMICVGRFIALFNYLAKAKITALAGVEE